MLHDPEGVEDYILNGRGERSHRDGHNPPTNSRNANANQANAIANANANIKYQIREYLSRMRFFCLSQGVYNMDRYS